MVESIAHLDPGGVQKDQDSLAYAWLLARGSPSAPGRRYERPLCLCSMSVYLSVRFSIYWSIDMHISFYPSTYLTIYLSPYALLLITCVYLYVCVSVYVNS